MSGRPSLQPSRLPDQFPVGTKHVIEGRAGHITLQYLEFPDGRRIDLAPAEMLGAPIARPINRRRRQPQKTASKKYSKGSGTPARLAG